MDVNADYIEERVNGSCYFLQTTLLMNVLLDFSLITFFFLHTLLSLALPWYNYIGWLHIMKQSSVYLCLLSCRFSCSFQFQFAKVRHFSLVNFKKLRFNNESLQWGLLGVQSLWLNRVTFSFVDAFDWKYVRKSILWKLCLFWRFWMEEWNILKNWGENGPIIRFCVLFLILCCLWCEVGKKKIKNYTVLGQGEEPLRSNLLFRK